MIKENFSQQGRRPKTNGGFIQIIIAIVVVILILTFFRVNLRALVESDTGKTNFAYVWELITKAWTWFWHWITQNGTKLATWFKYLTK